VIPDALDSRVLAARGLVAELADIVERGGYEGAVWYRKLQDIATVLGETDRPAQDLLRDAAEMLDAMYEGPRNFSDFHIYRDDPVSRVAANENLAALVGELTTMLRAK
jgi:hypothetical protein